MDDKLGKAIFQKGSEQDVDCRDLGITHEGSTVWKQPVGLAEQALARIRLEASAIIWRC